MTALFPTSLHAQTQKQKALVRTRVSADMKGGDPIPGAEVKLKGGNRYTSDTNGMFSFPVRGNFEIIKAMKEGYVMIDPAYLKDFTRYSDNPIPVIMETRQKRNAEVKAQEERLIKQLMEENSRLNHINDSLLKSRAINETEYDSLYEVNSMKYSHELGQLRKMAERLASFDYALYPESDRKIYAALSQGNYDEAFGLLKSQKSIDELERELAELQTVAQVAQEVQNTAGQAVIMKRKEVWRQCYSWHEYYTARFMFDSAAHYLVRALNIDTTNCFWIDECASYYREFVADYSTSLEYCQMGMRHVSDTTSDTMVAFLVSAGLACNDMGRYAEALSFFSRAENRYSDSKPINTAKILHNIGLAYHSLDKDNEAIEYLGRAAAAVGDDSLLLPMIYTVMNATFNDMGKDSIGLQYGRKALEIYQAMDSNIAPYELWAIYTNLATSLYHLNNIDSALQYYQEALNETEKNYGEHHPHVAQANHNMGVILTDMGEREKGLAYHRRAMKIFEKNKGLETPAKADIYGSLVDYHIEKESYDSALFYAKTMVAIRENCYGRENPKTQRGYEVMGDLYKMLGFNQVSMGNLLKAKEFLLCSKSYYERTGNSKGVEVSNTYFGLAYVYYHLLGDYGTASVYYKECIDASVGESEDAAKAFYEIGRMALFSDNFEMALEYFREALPRFVKMKREGVEWVTDNWIQDIRDLISDLEKQLKE